VFRWGAVVKSLGRRGKEILNGICGMRGKCRPPLSEWNANSKEKWGSPGRIKQIKYRGQSTGTGARKICKCPCLENWGGGGWKEKG